MSKLTFVWNGNRDGNAILTGLGAETTIAIGKDSRGSGEGFSPKELLASAGGACLIATLVSNIDLRKLPVETKEMDTYIDKVDDKFVVKHVIRLELTAGSTDEDVEKVSRAIDSSERACNIGKILEAGGVSIEIEKQITIK